jgi:hypothetical protein
MCEPFGERLRQLRLRDGSLLDHGAFCRRLADVSDPEAQLFHGEAVADESLEDGRRKKRELLCPDGGSDVDREATVAEVSRSRTLADPVPDQAPPSIPVHAVLLRAEAWAPLEQRPERSGPSLSARSRHRASSSRRFHRRVKRKPRRQHGKIRQRGRFCSGRSASEAQRATAIAACRNRR